MTKFDKQLYVEIGKQLKQARLKKGYSLDELSEALFCVKTKSTLKRYEDGESRIDMEIMQAICSILDLDMGEVIRHARCMVDFKDISPNLNEDNKSQDFPVFTDPQDAMIFIIKNPIMMNYGGYDINKMSDEEIIEFANQTVDYMKYAAQKYKK